jgi:GT2 family glycosyltransferase
MRSMSKKTIRGLGVVIASTNRPEILKDTLFSLSSRQTLPEMVVVSVAKDGDCDEELDKLNVSILVVTCELASLPAQRNRGVSALPSHIDVVVFLDDDMEIHDQCMEEVKAIFDRNLELAAFSGCILANGSISRQDARGILNGHTIPVGMPDYGMLPNDWPGLYGCCMCVRRALVDKEPFDENLPLYAIGEDAEIGFRLRKFGKIGGSARCPVVHLASPSGRVSEVGVGYAQIINFIYFIKKRIGFPFFATVWRHLVIIPATNLLYSLFPSIEKKKNIDRKGRLLGNFFAIRDLLFLKLNPDRLKKYLARRKI